MILMNVFSIVRTHLYVIQGICWVMNLYYWKGLLPESSQVVTALPDYRVKMYYKTSKVSFFSLKPDLDTH